MASVCDQSPITTAPPTYNQRLSLLQVALGAVSGHMTDGASVTIYDRRLAPYLWDLVEDGWVLDNRAALTANPFLAVRQPLCKGDLPPGTVDKFDHDASQSIVAQVIASEPENPACGLAQLMIAAPDCGAFDYVAPDVYAAWWRQHGARVGQRRGDTIVWEDGVVEPIRPAGQRFLGA